MRAGEKVAVVLGARGTLGTALCAELPRRGWRVAAALGHADCDIRDDHAVRAVMADARPTAVFNAAAYTNVDQAELEPDLAAAINATGAGVVARAAAELGAVVVHYSTDFVFDGELGRPYVEDDPPSPQGAYARGKVAGDAAVAAANEQHFVLRVGGLYGIRGKNFPSTIPDRLRGGQTVRADQDRLTSPTPASEVAAVSAVIVETPHFGLYHCTAQGETSWAGFARRAAEILGLPAARVEGVPSDALKLRAARPRRAVLDNRNLRARGLDTLSPWDAALAAFITATTPTP